MPDDQKPPETHAPLLVVCSCEAELSCVLQEVSDGEGLILQSATSFDDAVHKIKMTGARIVVLGGTLRRAVAFCRRLQPASEPTRAIFLDEWDEANLGVPRERQQLLRHPAFALVLDIDRHRAWYETTEIALTKIEFELLRLLLQNPGKILSRDQLIAGAWPRHVFVDHRTVTIHIGRLRRRLQSCLGHDLIRTVRNYGYGLGEQRPQSGEG